MGMGIFFLLALAVFLYVTVCHYRICKDQPLFQTACICTGLGCVFLYMSTCYFPWDTIVSWGETASDIVRPLQYPWRMLEIATALLCVSACFAFSVLFRVMEKNTAYVVFAVALVLSAVNISWYFYDFCFGGEPYRVYETYEINSMQMYSYEYLPDGTKPELIVDNALLQKGIDRMEGYEKQGTTIRCSVTAGNREGYIDFPLNYYKHYSCKRPDTGENLFVSAGYNNMVRVTFPADFDGDVVVSFEEPWYWRLSECISFLCMAICALTAAYSGLSGRYGLHFFHRKRKDNGL